MANDFLYAVALVTALIMFFVFIVFMFIRSASKRFDSHVTRHELKYAIGWTVIFLSLFILVGIGKGTVDKYRDDIYEECVERHSDYPDDYNLCPICGDSLN